MPDVLRVGIANKKKPKRNNIIVSSQGPTLSRVRYPLLKAICLVFGNREINYLVLRISVRVD